MHKRNTTGIKVAAQEKRRQALERTEKAISSLIKEQKPINFNSVANAANVSTTWLYNEPTLCERIKFLRNQGKTKRLTPKTRSSDASKDAMLRTLKDKNRLLRDEVTALKRELERAYGKLLDANKAIKHLEIKSNHLRKNIADCGSTVADSHLPTQNESDNLTKVEALGIRLSPALITLIERCNTVVIDNAIKAFGQQQSTILNPGGWFRKALEENWEATEPLDQSLNSKAMAQAPPEFTAWYAQAVKDGFLVDDPINMLPTMGGEIQVKICRPDITGAPYTLSPWQAAKLEWEAVQGIDD